MELSTVDLRLAHQLLDGVFYGVLDTLHDARTEGNDSSWNPR